MFLFQSGGFGNLIALILQRVPRNKGYSAFVDDRRNAYTDQWVVLKDVGRMDTEQVRALLEKTRGDEAPLGRETCVVSERIGLGRIIREGMFRGLAVCFLPNVPWLLPIVSS